MINPYLEPEVIIAQLKHEISFDRIVNWDTILETGTYVDGYIAYYFSFDNTWLITNYWTGFVEHMCLGKDVTDKRFWSC